MEKIVDIEHYQNQELPSISVDGSFPVNEQSLFIKLAIQDLEAYLSNNDEASLQRASGLINWIANPRKLS